MSHKFTRFAGCWTEGCFVLFMAIALYMIFGRH